MSQIHDRRLPAHLRAIARVLREQRPVAASCELESIERSARARARRIAYATPKRMMRPRLVIAMTLVTGFLLSGAGSVLAVSGESGSGSAGIAQYGVVNGQGTPTTPQGSTPGGNAPGSNSPASSPGGNTPGGSQVQAGRQIATGGGGQLPFTGYAAIPVLLAGIALLAGGLVARRRTAGWDVSARRDH